MKSSLMIHEISLKLVMILAVIHKMEKNGRMHYGEDTNFPSYVFSMKEEKWKAKNLSLVCCTLMDLVMK